MAYQRVVRRKECRFMSRVGFLNRLFTGWVLPFLILALVSFAAAQGGKSDGADPAAADTSSAPASTSTPASTPVVQETDPLKRPLTDKQKKQNSKSLKIELSKTYKKWL